MRISSFISGKNKATKGRWAGWASGFPQPQAAHSTGRSCQLPAAQPGVPAHTHHPAEQVRNQPGSQQQFIPHCSSRGAPWSQHAGGFQPAALESSQAKRGREQGRGHQIPHGFYQLISLCKASRGGEMHGCMLQLGKQGKGRFSCAGTEITCKVNIE